ncbi:MAG: hypothetical protein OEY38_04795 [Gammaproteobacteria bacterium]|nr:hypothetical protein [Gammaproteobacteria bacterium]
MLFNFRLILFSTFCLLANASLYAQTSQEPSLVEAWFTESAEQGDTEAQHSLGWLYSTGTGVERNPGLGMKWYRTAAHAEHAEAQLRLAILLAEKNKKESLQWLKRASNNNHALAKLISASKMTSLKDEHALVNIVSGVDAYENLESESVVAMVQKRLNKIKAQAPSSRQVTVPQTKSSRETMHETQPELIRIAQKPIELNKTEPDVLTEEQAIASLLSQMKHNEVEAKSDDGLVWLSLAGGLVVFGFMRKRKLKQLPLKVADAPLLPYQAGSDEFELLKTLWDEEKAEAEKKADVSKDETLISSPPPTEEVALPIQATRETKSSKQTSINEVLEVLPQRVDAVQQAPAHTISSVSDIEDLLLPVKEKQTSPVKQAKKELFWESSQCLLEYSSAENFLQEQEIVVSSKSKSADSTDVAYLSAEHLSSDISLPINAYHQVQREQSFTAPNIASELYALENYTNNLADTWYRIGQIYLQGDLVKQDLYWATFWLSKAANAGHRYAQSELQILGHHTKVFDAENSEMNNSLRSQTRA